jgi:hypothetical protein
MESLLQLHLESNTGKAEAENVPRPEQEQPKIIVPSKRLNRIINRAAHKAATEFRKGGSGGIFSK